METALDCVDLQLPVCVVLDGSRYYKYCFHLYSWGVGRRLDSSAAVTGAAVALPSPRCWGKASLLFRSFASSTIC